MISFSSIYTAPSTSSSYNVQQHRGVMLVVICVKRLLYVCTDLHQSHSLTMQTHSPTLRVQNYSYTSCPTVNIYISQSSNFYWLCDDSGWGWKAQTEPKSVPLRCYIATAVNQRASFHARARMSSWRHPTSACADQSHIHDIASLCSSVFRTLVC